MAEEQSTQSRKNSLLDGWNAPPNLVTYCRIVLVVVFLGLYIAAGAWGTLVVASVFAEFPWWATILFLIREIGITVMRFFVMERPGGKVIAAAWPGKLKTLFQCIGLAMLLIPAQIGGPQHAAAAWVNVYYVVTYVMLYVALVLCLYSGGIYLYNTFIGSRKAAND